MEDEYNDIDAKVIFSSMQNRINKIKEEKEMKKIKKTYFYWLKWCLGIQSPFIDAQLVAFK